MKYEKNWIRARSTDQVEERVKTILDAAGRIFLKTSYEEVTLLMIAKEAHFTRSNLYRYFKTREEIFLTLFLSDSELWLKEIIASFTQEMTLEAFTKKWTELLCRQKRLLDLSPLLAIYLEKNTSEPIYRKTKLILNEKINSVIPTIQKTIPQLTKQQIFEFILFHQALLAGCRPMAQYTEMQNRIIDELNLTQIKITFDSFYQKAIFFYLKGVTG